MFKSAVVSSFVLGLLMAGSASAQAAPPCEQTCAQNAARAAGCSSVSTACVCGNQAFLSSGQRCIESACGQDVQARALAVFNALCASQTSLPSGPITSGWPSSTIGNFSQTRTDLSSTPTPSSNSGIITVTTTFSNPPSTATFTTTAPSTPSPRPVSSTPSGSGASTVTPTATTVPSSTPSVSQGTTVVFSSAGPSATNGALPGYKYEGGWGAVAGGVLAAVVGAVGALVL